MSSSGIVWGVIILIVVVGGIWWIWSAGNTPVATSTTPTAETQPTDTQAQEMAVLASGTSTALGTYLRATDGMTLYTFTKDSAASSTCYGSCATKWPALTTTANVGLTALDSVIAGSISTITRADGAVQITYNDKPLYFYYLDTKIGDTKGNGVGGVWFVAKP